MFLSYGILTKPFDQTPKCKIKAKSILIEEMTQCSLKWHKVTKQILSSHIKLNHTAYN
jgi:hypothetical protein